jgi:hypothetical protein
MQASKGKANENQIRELLITHAYPQSEVSQSCHNLASTLSKVIAMEILSFNTSIILPYVDL